MITNRIGLAVAIAAVFTLLPSFLLQAQDSKTNGKHRIVFEVTRDGPEQWTGVLNNVANVQEAFGKTKTEVEVVAHSNGLGVVLKSNGALKDRMQKLASGGVVFAACENTMKKKSVSKEDLLPFVMTVDSGVAEVVRKQEAGWAYLKSGN